MDFSTVCRTCLKETNLNPIFPKIKDWRRYSNAIFITTGIKVEPNDGLPQKICNACLNFLNESLKFRRNCKDVQNSLENIKKELQNGTENTYEEWLNDVETDSPILPSEVKKGNTSIKIEIDPVESESDEIKTEYLNFDALDDENDEKPLKYLVDENLETVNYIVISNDTVNKDCTFKKVNKNKSDPPYLSSDSKSRTKRVICKLCQKDLSIRSIDSHMDRAHPGADERKIKCELCDSYVTKEKMSRHMKMVHGIKNDLENVEKKFVRCGYCRAEFDSIELLKDHVTDCTHKKKKRKAYEPGRQLSECDICNKQMQKASIRLHKLTAHAGMKPVCEHCGRTFGNKFRLNEHYRAKHGYEKFKCSYCEFESAGIMAMRNHERRHRGEKPFVCETCGAKFHAAYLLAQHKQSHRTDRPVKCDLCPASFKATNSLHMHKKACHGPLIYKCTVCPREYSCRHYAVKHMRRAHRYNGPLSALIPALQPTDIQADVGDSET